MPTHTSDASTSQTATDRSTADWRTRGPDQPGDLAPAVDPWPIASVTRCLHVITERVAQLTAETKSRADEIAGPEPLAARMAAGHRDRQQDLEAAIAQLHHFLRGLERQVARLSVRAPVVVGAPTAAALQLAAEIGAHFTADMAESPTVAQQFARIKLEAARLIRYGWLLGKGLSDHEALTIVWEVAGIAPSEARPPVSLDR